MHNRKTLITTLVAGVVVIAIAATAAMAITGRSSASRATVKTGHALGERVIVTPRGLTLYSLSAETGGRFICSNAACLSLWKPLTVARGTKPSGVTGLATVRRPDGRTQVTFKHKPLYTFVRDTKPGQAHGEGFKDVGTWHVAAISSASKAPAQPQPMSPTYGGY